MNEILLDGQSLTIEQVIAGTVSKDTFSVIVNDYRLSKYVPGSGKFEYYAKTVLGNLVVGENEYIIYAEDKAGNRSEPTTLVLTLTQETYDEMKKDDEEAVSEDSGSASNSDSSVPAASSSGGVKITGPNNGESFTSSETEFDITGTVPEGTAKVVVNDYTLSKFTAGDSSFSYKASTGFGNLNLGEKNTYTAIAYDAEGGKLGEASITIDVESGSASAPVITIPSSNGSYSTSLNEVVIGGTVGKWITRVKINGINLNEYIPGSGEWRNTVQLQSGDNSFSVCAEQEGSQVGCSNITINYQP